MTEKTVPFSLEAETALLGSLFIDPEAYTEIAGVVEASHFYLQKHRWIYSAVKALRESGEPTDYVTLLHELDRREQLEAIGGAVYLSQLAGCVPSALHIASYARIVVDTYKRRETLDLVSEIARVAYNEAEDMSAVAGYIQDRIADLFATKDRRNWQPFSDLAPSLTPIKWLWPDWVPVAMLSLLGATPGAGKSMIALDMCKTVMHGLTFPTGGSPTPPRNVIYVDAEVVPQVIKERSEKWKMDMTKFFTMLPRPNELVDFTRPEYREQLRSMAAAIKPGLIVIDSLSSITSKGENAIEDVRQIMGFLNDVAGSNQTAVVIIHHLRKRGPAQWQSAELSIDDFRGSSHIVAMARSVIGVSVVQTGPDIDPNGPRKLSVLKSNLCRIPDPVSCEFLPMYPSGVIVQWAKDVPKPYKPPTKLEECTRFLQTLLKDGEPLSPKEIMGMAREEGFSRDLVFQARKELGKHVQNTGGYKDPSNQWEWVD